MKLTSTPLIIVTLALAVLGAPLAAEAQQPGKIPRIAFLWAGLPGLQPEPLDGLRQGLRELGYIEGQTIIIEARYAENKLERLPALVAALVSLKVDVILALGGPTVRAAKEGTTTIPIVMSTGDPLSSGFVASLARPGGNVTGMTMMQGGEGMPEKWLELLKETVPRVSRVAYLAGGTPDDPGGATFKALERVAPVLGVSVHAFRVQRPDEIEGAFVGMIRQRMAALVVQPGQLTVSHHARIVTLAAKHRLPAMYEVRHLVTSGGLMSYGANLFQVWRRLATYVDKILKGARPADLPVEQPTNFHFVINLKTAKALGLTIPPSVLARADEVIE